MVSSLLTTCQGINKLASNVMAYRSNKASDTFIAGAKMSFKDKVVIVTGSSSGIGAKTAVEFAKEGAHVVIVGRNETKLKSVQENCEKFGQKALVINADVSKDEDGRKIIDDTVAKYGRIDVLVNNAGIADMVEITDENFMDVFDRQMAVNVRGLVFITHRAIPHIIKSKGNIINISSVAGIRTRAPFIIPYGVSKAAVNHFTQTTALKLSTYGVRVNAVCPGPVRTDLIDNSTQRGIASWDRAAQTTALKRVCEPQEIADLVLFLASHKAVGITGSLYLVDNGAAIMN